MFEEYSAGVHEIAILIWKASITRQPQSLGDAKKDMRQSGVSFL
jgi:hypothetical protein